MYSVYNVFVTDGERQFKLTYKLAEHNVAQTWANIMTKMTINNLRTDKNPWSGLDTSVYKLVDKLVSIVNDINKWIPELIELEWDSSDVQGSVNKYHTHFPEYNHITDELRRSQLSKYNDIIHEIEEAYRSNKGHAWPGMLLCPDTNLPVNVPLVDEDLKQVQSYFEFGDLVLGYSQIGRHPLEIYWANDIDVPFQQIIPHNVVGPIHYLRFREYSVDMKDFEQFYHSSGILWPYTFDDPRLAAGYIVMGKLVAINNVEMSEKEILSIVTACNRVVGWTIS